MNGNRGRLDFLLLIITVLLVGFGLIMIFSASSPMAVYKHSSASYYVYKQGLFAFIGLGLMLLFTGIPYSFWQKTAPYLLLASLLMLILVLIAGASANGARRWFIVGGIALQPAEFTKLSVIVYLAALISKKGDKTRLFKKGLLPILIVVGFIFLLIMLQPDFGTVLILLFITATIISIGGFDWRHLFMLSLGLIPLFIYLAVSKSYRLKRLISFLDPFENPTESGYQLIQSFYALGHGGLTGAGLGGSVQKFLYLPEAHTDFIFAVIGEEWGFIGGTLFILVFILFIWRGCLAAARCQQPFGMLLGMGIVAMISIQALLNLGAVTGSLPITGVPLPFVSYGGSSLILCMVSTGMLLSISRDRQP
ncbi:putative lipid II flippase FtsW [Paenibacillus piri]|uniref:Probable peptidoglycan glycosyltransferase FtsW n=1 Tax=Paenibacillus piri TaxID=2547395 RepID=A0A4R5KQB9_9BACL|nr:putative lipid II flippase FtsW [Paenibacillus piri]TDF97168.1 putative lipid II flippase FtsW [Paenibacillus piri]